MKTKYLQLGDVKIAYCEHGSGVPLLLLHGNSESKSIFRELQLKHFRHFHTYAIDSRGHGQSTSADGEYSISQLSDDVANFCKKLGIRKTYVVGFSDGGNICLLLAKKHPEIFEKIVALSPNYLVSGMTDDALRALNRRYKMLLLLEKLRLPVRKSIMRWRLMLVDIGITDDELKSIRANVCMLYAENDVVKEEHLLKMSQLIAGCRVKKIARCNHFNIYKKEAAVKEMSAYLTDAAS
jgi:pimeloyl-ACP methyl ester carboxylesterase